MSYEWDTRCADLELFRLEQGFTDYDHTNFAAQLLSAFSRVEAVVHVETGRLKASGKADIHHSSSRLWSGDISFGGGEVRWAASEFFGYSPKHGGFPSHQYFRVAGWLPQARGAVVGEGVPKTLSPARDVPGGGSNAVEDAMLGPVSSFISRGRRTPHPEGQIG